MYFWPNLEISTLSHSALMGNLIKVKGTAMGPLQGDPAWSGGTQTA